MNPYVYTPLNTDKSEIRLIQLAPGKTEDPISFSIIHASLIVPQEPREDTRLSVKELQKMLPDDWLVKKTLGGRYLFMRMGASGTPNSWNHPDPAFDRSLYESSEPSSMAGYEPEYEALSYTWGSSADLVTAIIQEPGDDNILTNLGSLDIGQNLACALKCLRLREHTRTLWVDAVCINQQDIEERNTQVPRMGNIYSLAKTVLIRLGTEGDNSTHALNTLGYFAQQVEFSSDGYMGDAPGAHEPSWFDPQHTLPYDNSTWTAITSLFHRPWFTRVWVLQEAILARNAVVQCGECFMKWLTLRKVILVLSSKVTLSANWTLSSDLMPMLS